MAFEELPAAAPPVSRVTSFNRVCSLLIVSLQKHHKLKAISCSKITHCPLMSAARATAALRVNRRPFIFFLLLPTVRPSSFSRRQATSVSNKAFAASWLNGRSRSSILGDEGRPQNNDSTSVMWKLNTATVCRGTARDQAELQLGSL